MVYKIKNIVFIESNTTGSGEEFIIRALKNFQVVFLTANPEKYKFLEKLLIHPVLLDTTNVDLIIEYLKFIPNLIGVISTSDSYAYQAAKVSQYFCLPGSNPQSILNCSNKLAFCNILNSTNLKKINSKFIGSADNYDNENLLQDFIFPVIVKPNVGTGSIGVKLCYNIAEVDNQIQKIIHINNHGVLIQEYIKGEEYSAEIIVSGEDYQLLGITKKFLGSEPYFIEIGHEFPANLNIDLKDYILKKIIEALQAVDYNFGPAHIEFKLFAEKIYIIEINPRLAGGMIPSLIEEAQGIKLIDNLIKLYVGQKTNFKPKLAAFTKIQFYLPQHSGFIQSIEGINSLKKYKNVIKFKALKSKGEYISIQGDFRDRLGFVIVKSNNSDKCKSIINQAFKEITFSINSSDQGSNNYNRERLQEPISHQIFEILEYNFYNSLSVFDLLTKINQAHAIMLNKCNIISNFQLSALLRGIKEVSQNSYLEVQEINNPVIGYYLAYEQVLVKKIGIKAAGVLHTARSRNDVNATIVRLKSRHIFLNLYKAIWGLRSELLKTAKKYLNTSMPIYSQYQPAMPGSYSYYLLGIEGALISNQSNLLDCLKFINISPLGSGAGGGTSFSINPQITAKLLGFKNSSFNALSGVATRDAEVNLLTFGAMLGVNLSRIAQDYQIWSTQEFNFFDFPDTICGISSAMPQKKNPYLLEKIKGKAAAFSGQLFATLSAMQKTPFSNSVEIGEALRTVEDSFNELIIAIKMLKLVIASATPKEDNMIKSNEIGLTIASGVAESMVNETLSFKEAYSIVAKNLSDSQDHRLLEKVLSLTNISSDSKDWHKLFEYGNGPGEKSTQRMLVTAEKSLVLHANIFYSLSNEWDRAHSLLAQEIRKNIILK